MNTYQKDLFHFVRNQMPYGSPKAARPAQWERGGGWECCLQYSDCTTLGIFTSVWPFQLHIHNHLWTCLKGNNLMPFKRARLWPGISKKSLPRRLQADWSGTSLWSTASYGWRRTCQRTPLLPSKKHSGCPRQYPKVQKETLQRYVLYYCLGLPNSWRWRWSTTSVKKI